MTANRRRFLQTAAAGSALLSTSATVPSLLARTAAAPRKGGGEKILVVVQLSGGNDGLNTVVPLGDPNYTKNRLALGLEKSSLLKLDAETALHPSMKGFAKLFQDGKLSVVQGVGYANPDRSHFSSMDIWHTAERNPELQREGWLGRYLNRDSRDAAILGKERHAAAALHLGASPLPLALVSRTTPVPSLDSLEGFRLNGRADAVELEKLAAIEREEPSDMLAFLQRTTLDAYDTGRRVREALAARKSGTKYPDRGLAKKLEQIAQLIDAEFETRIYYVQLDGFDTHANQKATHANLLAELSESVAAFVQDLEQRGHLERTCVLMFSEFGRRVKENASQGTDHGTAGPMFLAGGGLKAGIIGKQPRLDDLDREGDLKFHTDFRRVYATVLESWLNVAPREVLKAEYESLPLFSAASGA